MYGYVPVDPAWFRDLHPGYVLGVFAILVLVATADTLRTVIRQRRG